jgi:pyruvate/2-oxoglutarate dehydrogenase complex dihydrolipoamide dehydrogenase (E3) component
LTDRFKYDDVLIGSGQANNPLATALAEADRKVAVIEREHVGGTCINKGCTPSKTMIASARVAYQARNSEELGVHTGSVEVDMAEVRRRKRDIVKAFRTGSRQRLEEADGVDLYMGEGSLIGPRSVHVALDDGVSQELEAERIFINTGLRPRRPDLTGLGDVPALDSTSIMELDEVPGHLLIVGGGYVGIEFAQMFRRFGSQVTMVQRGKQLLSHEDEDMADAVAEILREDGIQVWLKAEASRIVQDKDNQLTLWINTRKGEKTIQGSHLLLAAGRVPNTERLNLDAAGVETDERGYIRVNARLATNVPGIYALGDVKGGPAFTHVSYDDFRIIRATLLRDEDRLVANRILTYTVFMDPQLGRVGLTEAQAREADHDVRVAKMPMGHVARAIETGETRGVIKAVVDADTEQILGAAVLGSEGGELVSLLKVAMMGGLPYTALRDGVFPHPTLAESLNNLFMSMD